MRAVEFVSNDTHNPKMETCLSTGHGCVLHNTQTVPCHK
jgi:hypothetical protein